MEKAPHKKDDLTIANHVLKLASKLLKVILFLCLLDRETEGACLEAVWSVELNEKEARVLWIKHEAKWSKSNAIPDYHRHSFENCFIARCKDPTSRRLRQFFFCVNFDLLENFYCEVCPEMHKVVKMAKIRQNCQIRQADFALTNLTEICKNPQIR